MQRTIKLGIILAAALIAYTIAALILVGNKVPHRFINADHPIDAELDRTGTWFYYSMPGKPTDFVEVARTELASKGFAEDSLHKPWFHFTNGGREVIICNAAQSAVSNDAAGYAKIVDPKFPPTPGWDPNKYTTVWVHEPGGSRLQEKLFKIKKTILLW